MRTTGVLAFTLGCLSVAGCYHVTLEPIAPVAAERLPIAARVDVPAATATAIYEVHSGMAGFANSWTIDVGKAIVQYAGAYLPNAFMPGGDVTVRVELATFDVHDFEAHAAMRFTVVRGEQAIYDKTYQCRGEGYAARVVWGGAFAMKSAMRKTTDEALRMCFSQFLDDARVEHPTWVASS